MRVLLSVSYQIFVPELCYELWKDAGFYKVNQSSLLDTKRVKLVVEMEVFVRSKQDFFFCCELSMAMYFISIDAVFVLS